MRHFIVLTLISLSISFSHADVLDFAKPDVQEQQQKEQAVVEGGIAKKIWDRAQRTTFNINIDILDFSSASGFNADLSAPYKIEPSYMDDLHTRREKYVFGADWDVEKSWDFLDQFMGVNGGGKLEFEFARQFERFEDAWNVIDYPPYTPKHIPLTPEAAIEQLVPLDFFGVKVNMAIVFSWLRGNYSHSVINADAKGTWLYKGEFLIHIFRLADNKVKVKLIGLKTKGPELTAKVRLQPTLNYFGWNPLNNWFERWGTMDLAKGTKTGFSQVDLPDMEDGLLMADYVFDLNNEDARTAYRNLFNKFYVIKDNKVNFELFEGFDVINPIQQNLNASKKYIAMSLAEVERIYNEDKHLEASCPKDRPPQGDEKCPRIERNLAAQNQSVSNGTSYSWGLGTFYSRENKTNYTKSKITYRDENNNLRYANHLLYEDSKQGKSWFSTFKHATIKSLDVLCDTDESFENCNFQGLGVKLEMTDTDYDAEEHRTLLNYIHDSLPGAIFKQIPWKGWDKIKDRKNAYINLAFLFKKEALNLTSGFGGPKPNIKGLLTEYVKQKEPFINQAIYNNYPTGDSSEPNFNQSTEPSVQYAEDIELVSNKLSIAFDDSKTDNTRVAALIELRGNEFFQKFGTGFVISLLSADTIHELLFVKLRLSAVGSERVDWKFGSSEKTKIYQSFVYMQSLMSSRSIDPRIQNELSDEATKEKLRKVKP